MSTFAEGAYPPESHLGERSIAPRCRCRRKLQLRAMLLPRSALAPGAAACATNLAVLRNGQQEANASLMMKRRRYICRCVMLKRRVASASTSLATSVAIPTECSSAPMTGNAFVHLLPCRLYGDATCTFKSQVCKEGMLHMRV